MSKTTELEKRIERLEKALYRLHPESYSNFDGREYKIDCFGDLFIKNEFGTWSQVIPTSQDHE